MATSKTTTETVVTDPLPQHNVNTADDFLKSKTAKTLLILVSAALAITAAWFAYHSFVKTPKEVTANEMIFDAENLFDKMAGTSFSKDSVNLVLNGGQLEGKNITGVLRVINNYGGTAAGNRGNYIAGASYLNIGEYEKALKFLKEFEGNGADQVQIQAYILMGQAYAEQKKTAEALEHFKKATSVNTKDETFTGNALLLAGNYAAHIGKNEEAKDFYEKLKNDYPKNTNVMNGEVDKLLASIGVVD